LLTPKDLPNSVTCLSALKPNSIRAVIAVTGSLKAFVNPPTATLVNSPNALN
jgi:hypothetical protein